MVSAPGGTYEVDGPEKVVSTLEASYHLLDDMRPLVNDQSAAVRENAMLAMGRLCGLSSKLKEQILSLQQTMTKMGEEKMELNNRLTDLSTPGRL